MDGRAAPRLTFTRMLSKGDKTALSVEDTLTDGLIRVRVENADVATSPLLTREEAEWLRDTLVAGIGSLSHQHDDGN